MSLIKTFNAIISKEMWSNWDITRKSFLQNSIHSFFFLIFVCFTGSSCLLSRTLTECKMLHRENEGQWLKAELRKKHPTSSTSSKQKQQQRYMRISQMRRCKAFRALISRISWNIYSTYFTSCFLFSCLDLELERDQAFIHAENGFKRNPFFYPKGCNICPSVSSTCHSW